jgi:hypothetical protein
MPSERMFNPIHLDVVAFQDHDGAWIAQCIQYDIVARAKTVLGVRRSFARQLKANMAINESLGRKGLEGIPSAPDKYRYLFEKAIEHMTPLSPIDDGMTHPPLDQIDIRLAEAA